jgi:hypothetical protein
MGSDGSVSGEACASITLLSLNAVTLSGRREGSRRRTCARRHDEPLRGSAFPEDDGKGVTEGAILGSKAATLCGNALRITRSTCVEAAVSAAIPPPSVVKRRVYDKPIAAKLPRKDVDIYLCFWLKASVVSSNS